MARSTTTHGWQFAVVLLFVLSLLGTPLAAATLGTNKQPAPSLQSPSRTKLFLPLLQNGSRSGVEHPPRVVALSITGDNTHIGNGPVAPPKSSDELFSTDQQPGGLDTYLFQADLPDGQIHTPITLSRFYSPILQQPGMVDVEGFLTDEGYDQIVAEEILPESVTLILSAYDVDRDGSSCDEWNHVSVNGLYVGTLTGASDLWTTNSRHYRKLVIDCGRGGKRVRKGETDAATVCGDGG